MERTLKSIVQELRDHPDLPPMELSNMDVWLVGEFSFLATELEGILVKKPAEWIRLRKDAKSVAETERMWQASEDGITETRLRMQLQIITKLLSSIRSRLRIKAEEAKQIM